MELLDSLAVERTHFCGLSLGGFVGQWLGVRAPERLNRLVLSNTSPFLGQTAQWDELIRTVLGERDMSAMADMFMGNWFPNQMLEEQPDIIADFRSMVMATSPEGLAGCFAVVRDADLRRTNTLIAATTLIIGGLDDTVTLATHSEEIGQAIPNARVNIMPGVHMLNVEQPRLFVQALRSFLSEA